MRLSEEGLEAARRLSPGRRTTSSSVNTRRVVEAYLMGAGFTEERETKKARGSKTAAKLTGRVRLVGEWEET